MPKPIDHAPSRSVGAEQRRPRARKRFGQHFLEPVWARKVVAVIKPQPGDVFLEIGPGPGPITRPLASAAAALLACEIDRDLAADLRDAGLPNVRVVEGDFLTLPSDTIEHELHVLAPGTTAVRVAGNLPYNVASPIMFRLVDLSRHGMAILDATVMLQREVADRLLAQPGSRDYGLLTVLLGHRASVDRLLDLPPGAFRPAPKVRSTVVRLRFHQPEPPTADEGRFAAVTQALFSRRRKTVANALLAYGGVTQATAARALDVARIESTRRPETLTRAELVRLADAVGPEGQGGRTAPEGPPVL
jgi:16S rRNA (adenine1518-N6/adenine1519-N6)-dimethyltransferase